MQLYLDTIDDDQYGRILVGGKLKDRIRVTDFKRILERAQEEGGGIHIDSSDMSLDEFIVELEARE